MLARVASQALCGLEGHAVEVEADIVAAAPAFAVVGLPDAAVQESRERVRAAIVNSAYEFPSRRITVNLAPADLRKEGPSFDLPIALAFLLATGQATRRPPSAAVTLAAVGELGLDGTVRPVAGVLALAESLRRQGARGRARPGRQRRPRHRSSGSGGVSGRDAARGRRSAWRAGRSRLPPADAATLLRRPAPGGAPTSPTSSVRTR